MSGNTCIQIVTSRCNYCIQNVMSHCRKISLLISKKERATEDAQKKKDVRAKKHLCTQFQISVYFAESGVDLPTAPQLWRTSAGEETSEPTGSFPYEKGPNWTPYA